MNHDVIRTILFRIEENENHPKLTDEDLSCENIAPETVSYYIDLLMDSQFIEAIDVPVLNAPYKFHIIKRITFSGHEYLNTIRNDKIWNKTKNRLLKLGGNVAFEVVKSIAVKLIVGD
ncbi:MAG: DUF2513 domain-containing protein [Oscillospiraceae bacterium]|nr:DUF2513 domain-containing protein [Oscillospiraceae bacterium]